MTKFFSYAEMVKDELLPVIEKGAKNAGVALDAEDCKKLVFLLRTSITLEPFLEIFVSIIQKNTSTKNDTDNT